MAQQNLDFGTAAANDGETLFDGFTKVQANFTELYGFVNPLSAAKGGTGVANNAASTLTISGAFATTLTVTNTTGVTLPVSGTLATLAGTEELTGKTLTSSVGKGTWTASGTWTLPAITLGGTVSGGGQQLNNIIIGTSTPLAGTFTTLTATTATITQGTITDPATNLSATVTWNDASDTFTAWKLNVTNTNSAAASLLLDLQVGSTSKFLIEKNGSFSIVGTGGAQTSSGVQFAQANANQLNLGFSGNVAFRFGTTFHSIRSDATFGWSSDTDPTSTNDVILLRDAANTLALRNSTNAQTFNWYYSYTDGSNYARGALKTGSGYVELAAETAGTGADNNDVRLTPSGTGNVYIPQTPAAIGTGVKTINAVADSSTNFGHYFVLNLNGTPYYIPCSSVAPT